MKGVALNEALTSLVKAEVTTPTHPSIPRPPTDLLPKISIEELKTTVGSIKTNKAVSWDGDGDGIHFDQDI